MINRELQSCHVVRAQPLIHSFTLIRLPHRQDLEPEMVLQVLSVLIEGHLHLPLKHSLYFLDLFYSAIAPPLLYQ